MKGIDDFPLLVFIWLLMVVYTEANPSLIICPALKTKLAEWPTKGMKYQESRIIKFTVDKRWAPCRHRPLLTLSRLLDMNIFMVKDFFFWYGDVPTFFAVNEMKMANEMAFNNYAAPCMLMHFGVKRAWQAVHEAVDVEKWMCQSEWDVARFPSFFFSSLASCGCWSGLL